MSFSILEALLVELTVTILYVSTSLVGWECEAGNTDG